VDKLAVGGLPITPSKSTSRFKFKPILFSKHPLHLNPDFLGHCPNNPRKDYGIQRFLVQNDAGKNF
jgi:hypothetical protein